MSPMTTAPTSASATTTMMMIVCLSEPRFGIAEIKIKKARRSEPFLKFFD
jgi:hypothetical protein